MRVVVAAALCLTVCPTACSWTFDGAAAVPLEGAPPKAEDVLQTIAFADAHYTVITDREGVAWAVFYSQPDSDGAISDTTVRLERLDGVHEIDFYDLIIESIGKHAIYGYRSLLRPGAATVEQVSGSLQIHASPNDDVVVWPLQPFDGGALQMWMLHLDSGETRQVPAWLDWDHLQVSEDGLWLFAAAPGQAALAMSTVSQRDVTLPLVLIPPLGGMVVDPSVHGDAALVLCDGGGVRRAGVAGDMRTLDTRPCTRLEVAVPGVLLWQAGGRSVLYALAGGARVEYPVDGTALAATPLGVAETRLHQHLLHDATDGWLGDWRFMQHGLDVRPLGDWRTLVFRDFVANQDNVGAVMAATPGADPATLAYNATHYELIDATRLVIADNRALAGEWNRVVVVDAALRRARWVADSAIAVMALPNNQALVERYKRDQDRLRFLDRVAVPRWRTP